MSVSKPLISYVGIGAAAYIRETCRSQRLPRTSEWPSNRSSFVPNPGRPSRHRTRTCTGSLYSVRNGLKMHHGVGSIHIRQTWGLNFLSKILDGISKIMYGTKKIVNAVLYFMPVAIPRSSSRPKRAALLMLTLCEKNVSQRVCCEWSVMGDARTGRGKPIGKERKYTGGCASQSSPSICAL